MEEKIKNLKLIIRKLMRQFNVPALSIGIFKDNDIVFEKGFGARNLEENSPMTSDTLIPIASISKGFTALLILKFNEDGLLNLEDPIKKYLNIEPFLSNPGITIRHLLSHSSGIPSVDGQWSPIAISFGDYERICPVTSIEDFLDHISDTKSEIFFPPGQKFFYNNDMYTILGLIIEKVTGRVFEEVMKEDIFKPLEMNRSTYSKEELENDPQQDYIKGYIHNDSEEKTSLKSPPLPFTEQLQAPGGIYTSIHEMMNYIRCLTNNGTFNDRSIISPETLNLLWTPRINSPYGYGIKPKYCLGWVEEENYLGQTLYHHGGGLGISTSFLGIIPKLKLGVAVAENDDIGICKIIGLSSIALMLGKDPHITVKELRLLEIYEKIRGTYKSSLDLYKLKVYLKGQSIYIDVETDDGKFTYPLIIDDYEKLSFKLFSTIPNELQKITFHQDSKTKIIQFATYDRYLYHKK